MATKENLEHIANLMTEAKQKIAEAARYAADHNIRDSINILGNEFYLENLDEELVGYDLDDEWDKKYYEQRKKEFTEMFGVSEGYVWASSSSFC